MEDLVQQNTKVQYTVYSGCTARVSIACTLSDHCCVYCPICRGPGLESAADRGLSDGCRRCPASLHTLHLSYCKEMKFVQCFFYFKTSLHVQYMYVKHLHKSHTVHCTLFVT